MKKVSSVKTQIANEKKQKTFRQQLRRTRKNHLHFIMQIVSQRFYQVVLFMFSPDLEHGRAEPSTLTGRSLVSHVEGHHFQLFLLSVVRRRHCMCGFHVKNIYVYIRISAHSTYFFSV